MPGRKLKPEGTARTRHQPRHEWIEVPRVPFEGAPALPKLPTRFRKLRPPAPTRPLGPHGLELWSRVWESGKATVLIDPEPLQALCELMDERVALRTRVLREGDWRDRNQLRTLDAQVMAGLSRLNDTGPRTPPSWPALTRRWWAAVSSMPHCVLWDDADWQFALDTALLAASFHAGDLRLASELRRRENVMGTTADARRDLRIRYVDDTGTEISAADQASVTAMDDYRKMAAG